VRQLQSFLEALHLILNENEPALSRESTTQPDMKVSDGNIRFANLFVDSSSLTHNGDATT